MSSEHPETKKRLRNTAAGHVLVLVAAFVLFFSSGCNLASNGNNLQGKRFFKVGDYNRAVTSFQKGITNNPRNADSYYNLGAVYHELAKRNQNNAYLPYAENYYRQAIQLNDQHVEAHRSLAVLLVETQRQNHGFDLIRTWQQRHPNSPEPLIELARLHQEFGDEPRAVQYLADAIGIDGRNARAHKAMAVIREKQGQYHLALDNYIRSYQSNNMQPDVSQRIAALQSRLQTASLPNYQFQNRQSAINQPGSARQYVPR